MSLRLLLLIAAFLSSAGCRLLLHDDLPCDGNANCPSPLVCRAQQCVDPAVAGEGEGEEGEGEEGEGEEGEGEGEEGEGEEGEGEEGEGEEGEGEEGEGEEGEGEGEGEGEEGEGEGEGAEGEGEGEEGEGEGEPDDFELVLRNDGFNGDGRVTVDGTAVTLAGTGSVVRLRFPPGPDVVVRVEADFGSAPLLDFAGQQTFTPGVGTVRVTRTAGAQSTVAVGVVLAPPRLLRFGGGGDEATTAVGFGTRGSDVWVAMRTTANFNASGISFEVPGGMMDVDFASNNVIAGFPAIGGSVELRAVTTDPTTGLLVVGGAAPPGFVFAGSCSYPGGGVNQGFVGVFDLGTNDCRWIARFGAQSNNSGNGSVEAVVAKGGLVYAGGRAAASSGTSLGGQTFLRANTVANNIIDLGSANSGSKGFIATLDAIDAAPVGGAFAVEGQGEDIVLDVAVDGGNVYGVGVAGANAFLGTRAGSGGFGVRFDNNPANPTGVFLGDPVTHVAAGPGVVVFAQDVIAPAVNLFALAPSFGTGSPAPLVSVPTALSRAVAVVDNGVNVVVVVDEGVGGASRVEKRRLSDGSLRWQRGVTGLKDIRAAVRDRAVAIGGACNGAIRVDGTGVGAGNATVDDDLCLLRIE